MDNILKLAKQIKLVIFDVDGVLTDGSLYITDDNIEIKAFHSQDGLGIKLLQQTGVKVAIITARQSQVVTHRMKSIGIEHIYQGNMNKTLAYEDVLDTLKLKDFHVAYVGDDVLDLPLIQRAGLGIAVVNSHSFIKPYADWTTTKSGGHGAAREVCDLIMQAQGTLNHTYDQYLLENQYAK